MGRFLINKIFQHHTEKNIDNTFPEIWVTTSTAEAWISFLFELKKSVVVKGCISTPRNSKTGVPEGDPISVVAAVMIGTLWHWYVSENPKNKIDVDPMVFVDNWE